MAFISPEQIIKNLDLEPGMIVVDFGSGSGHYTVEAAKIVGNAGKVYSVDIQKEMLQAVKSRCEVDRLDNVEIVWADLELPDGSHLAGNFADLVIISNILFQAEDKKSVAKEAFRILKNSGRAAVIEWVKSESKIGPPLEQRVNFAEAQKIFEEMGFKTEKEFEAGENHYGIIFRKI